MNARSLVLTACTAGILTSTAPAAFHLMQIEEIIGGIAGDPTAQAIQLRMRGGGQNQVQLSRLQAWDANGQNPVLLLDITATVSNSSGGAAILLSTASFDSYMAGVAGYDSDFTLANAIPASYLSGGKVTFEDDGGGVYWSVAFGNYTGTNTGFTDNDSNGNFGAPFPNALPTSTLRGIRFTGTSSALSTTNAADYAFTPDPATVRNNANQSFVVVPEPASGATLVLGALALGGMVFARRRR
jgi:hypothetical protein